jgi:hypothetical protein
MLLLLLRSPGTPSGRLSTTPMLFRVALTTQRSAAQGVPRCRLYGGESRVDSATYQSREEKTVNEIFACYALPLKIVEYAPTVRAPNGPYVMLHDAKDTLLAGDVLRPAAEAFVCLATELKAEREAHATTAKQAAHWESQMWAAREATASTRRPAGGNER